MSLDLIVSKFAEDPFNPQLNFDCAVEYDRLEQTASAISFYLRTAEYGQGVLVYNSLLKIARCFESQGQRTTTVKNSILQALSYMPERPEAYFMLSQYHERQGNWQECYTFAEMGLSVPEFDLLPASVGYHGDYCLEFEKGISAWWVGRQKESREILLSLYKRKDIQKEYKDVLKINLERVGINTEPTVFEMNARVSKIRRALKLALPETPFIRLGSAGDGGYVMADDITKNDCIISLGVDKNVDFEKDIAKTSKNIFMYDNSIDVLPEPVNGAIFSNKTMGAKAEGHTSLEDCLVHKGSDYILKMDIEGSEFDVLNEASTQTLSKFRQITIEVHWMDQLTDIDFYTSALAAFEKLRETHTPVLVHPNNDRPLMVLGNSPVPVVFEILYLRNDSYTWNDLYKPFEDLASRNNVDVPEMGLSFP
jgi:hypothetical protein